MVDLPSALVIVTTFFTVMPLQGTTRFEGNGILALATPVRASAVRRLQSEHLYPYRFSNEHADEYSIQYPDCHPYCDQHQLGDKYANRDTDRHADCQLLLRRGLYRPGIDQWQGHLH